jgi:hypothetical protein
MHYSPDSARKGSTRCKIKIQPLWQEMGFVVVKRYLKVWEKK